METTSKSMKTIVDTQLEIEDQDEIENAHFLLDLKENFIKASVQI